MAGRLEKVEKQWSFWIDRGGTFTDIVARAPDGALLTHKLLSENPERYEDAALRGIRDLMGLAAGEPIPARLLREVKMGTTVGTNALLERKGEPVLLVVSKGFRDALRIGYQNRPSLFDLHIRLPEMLHSRVLEVEERVSAHGEVLVPLAEDQARAGLQQAHDSGIRSVAIVFMHGYRFPAHEAVVAALAREIGFTQISAAHAVSPLMKLISRGDTTVVDAYLSPVLRRYVKQVAADLQGARLLFMKSDGGLTDAGLFAALGVVAGSQGTMNNFTFGNERWQYYETIAGGAGAGPDFDGASAVQTHMTNSRLTDPEVLEFRFPVLLEEFSIRRGSGGPGRRRGGDGVVRKVRFLEAMTASILSNNRTRAPRGLAGGGNARPGINKIIRRNDAEERLGSADQARLVPGDVFVIETPGGGGYGA